MKRYKSSDLTNKRSEVLKEARTNGVIIECRNTNGDVVDELVLFQKSDMDLLTDAAKKVEKVMIELAADSGVDISDIAKGG